MDWTKMIIKFAPLIAAAAVEVAEYVAEEFFDDDDDEDDDDYEDSFLESMLLPFRRGRDDEDTYTDLN